MEHDFRICRNAVALCMEDVKVYLFIFEDKTADEKLLVFLSVALVSGFKQYISFRLYKNYKKVLRS